MKTREKDKGTIIKDFLFILQSYEALQMINAKRIIAIGYNYNHWL